MIKYLLPLGLVFAGYYWFNVTSPSNKSPFDWINDELRKLN